MTTETIAVVWLASAIAAAAIGSTKGKGGQGLILGLLLGVLGVIVAATLTKTPEKQAADAAALRAAISPPSATPAGWWPDPYGRHQYRYWDGIRWTEHVTSNGQQMVDR